MLHRRSGLGSRAHRASKEHSEASETDSDNVAASSTMTRAQSKRRSQRRRTRKRLHTEPEMSQSREEFIADWGITPEEEEKCVRELQARMRKEGLITADMPTYYHDYYTIRRFVRARQHDLERAHTMLVNHIAWRKETGADNILDSFAFAERDSFLTIYPQGYHKTDKMGRPIYIQSMGSIDLKKILEVTSEERMVKFRIQEWERCLRNIMPACSKVAGRKVEQTFAILDVQGVGLRHFTGEVKRMLVKVTSLDQDNYPEMLGHTCIINAPSVFKVIWAFAKPLLDTRTQHKIEVCPRDYTPALLRWVDKENLPTFLGGTSTSTLLDDAGPWNNRQLMDEVEEEHRRAAGLMTSDDDLSTTSDVEERRAGAGTRQQDDGATGRVSEGADSATTAAAYSNRLSIRTAARAPSHASTADDADDFHSPRSAMSQASFLSAAPTFASVDSIKVDDDVQQPGGATESNGYYQPLDGTPPAHGTHKAAGGALLDRVQRLEQRLASVGGTSRAQPTALATGSSLSARVTNLEHAMEALLAAQEADMRAKEQAAQKQNDACCGCCSVM